MHGQPKKWVYKAPKSTGGGSKRTFCQTTEPVSPSSCLSCQAAISETSKRKQLTTAKDSGARV